MTFLTGFLMALADSVPGVSGGTIAYILKRYELLFKHINSILKRDFNKEAITFLVKLAIGWIIGFIAAILVITSIFESHIYEISSLFLGFIIISIVIVIRQELGVLKQGSPLFALLGFGLVCSLVVFQNSQLITLELTNLNIGSYIYIFIVGFAAICAMLLPGVSGSAVLMIFGSYFLVINSIRGLLEFDFSGLAVVIALGLGILCGAVSAVKTLSHLFETKRPQMVQLIIGMLVGSIIAIGYGPTAIADHNLAPLDLETFSIIYFIIGVALIAILEFAIPALSNKGKTTTN